MKRMFRFNHLGKKSHQLTIPAGSELLMHDTGWGITQYVLKFEIADWLKANCSGEYRVIPSRWCLDIEFKEERDATLFWTFHA